MVRNFCREVETPFCFFQKGLNITGLWWRFHVHCTSTSTHKYCLLWCQRKQPRRYLSVKSIVKAVVQYSFRSKMESVKETKLTTESLVGARESEETPPSPPERFHSDVPSSPSVLVSAMSVEEARKHRKRTLDALYAQRKRDCQRVEKEQLEETVGGLDRQNALLKQDNKRFEVLLRQAQAQVAVGEQEFASSTTGTFRGLSQSHQQGNSLQPNSSVGLPAQNQHEFPVTNRARRQGNPQDQDTPVVAQEQLLALLSAVLQGNTVPASASASLNISQLSSILNFDSQQSAESQQMPEGALAAAHQHQQQQQQQLVQLINLHSSASSTIPASVPVVTLTPAFTVSPRLPQGSVSSSAAAAATTTAASAFPPPFQQQQTPTPPNPNLSQILALGSAIENLLSARGQGPAKNHPVLQQQQQQPPQIQEHQQLQLRHQHQLQLQQQQEQTPAVDLKALASLLDPQIRAALVQWNQTLPTSQNPSELPTRPSGADVTMASLLGFAEQQRYRYRQQQIANPNTQYSSDSMLQGQLASLQAALKQQQQQQQQQQQFQQHTWQEEERRRTRQQKLAQQQQLWLRQQVPHHPRNPQIISESLGTTLTQTPNDMAQVLAMIAALQSQSSYPSR
jgi:hypothetical protein